MSTPSIPLPSSLLAATTALGETLSYAEPIVVYDSAQERCNHNPQAQALLRGIAEAQARLRSQQMSDTVRATDLENLRNLQRQMLANRVVMEYLEMQQKATAYLREVNQHISQLLGVDFAALIGANSC